MSHKKYFSYIRVSTQRQGQHGTSLSEQQSAIDQFARSWNLSITQRFEERETAAKQGRPVFLDMLKLLKNRKADGVIIHKIDRSARNLKDWADLGNLIDLGIEVHFASESLDLNSRGGRLSADIQAVVASDYIRNLSEEAKKGLYGRLKQGLFPFRAMTGYLDCGSGKPKVVDPVMGPLVRKAFELYVTGDWGLTGLVKEMHKLGLRSRDGNLVTRTALATILHNPFYMGLIKLRKSGKTFPGVHQPIVSKALYDQVQAKFAGKNCKTERRHFYAFRRLVSCLVCGNLMTAERQKGIVYYRCHTKRCEIRDCLREDRILQEILTVLKRLQFSDAEFRLLKDLSQLKTEHLEKEAVTARVQIEERQARLQVRHSRVADAFVDGIFDESTYSQKKGELVAEELELKEKLAHLASGEANLASRLDEFFELANSAYLSFKSAPPGDRRDLIRITTSNLVSDGKSVLVTLKLPFQTIAERTPVRSGWGRRNAFRTVSALVSQVLKCFSKKEAERDLRNMGLAP